MEAGCVSKGVGKNYSLIIFLKLEVTSFALIK